MWEDKTLKSDILAMWCLIPTDLLFHECSHLLHSELTCPWIISCAWPIFETSFMPFTAAYVLAGRRAGIVERLKVCRAGHFSCPVLAGVIFLASVNWTALTRREDILSAVLVSAWHMLHVCACIPATCDKACLMEHVRGLHELVACCCL
jgi:hypothetical protein